MRRGDYTYAKQCIDELHVSEMVYQVWPLLLQFVITDVSVANPSMIRIVFDSFKKALPQANENDQILKIVHALCMIQKTQLPCFIRWVSRNTTEFPLIYEYSECKSSYSEWGKHISDKGLDIKVVVKAFSGILDAIVDAHKKKEYDVALTLEKELMGLVGVLYAVDVHENRLITNAPKSTKTKFYKRPLAYMFKNLIARTGPDASHKAITTILKMCEEKLGIEEYNLYCAVLICTRQSTSPQSYVMDDPPVMTTSRMKLDCRSFKINIHYLDQIAIRTQKVTSRLMRDEFKKAEKDPSKHQEFRSMNKWDKNELFKSHGEQVTLPLSNNMYMPKRSMCIPHQLQYTTPDPYSAECIKYSSDVISYASWLKTFGSTLNDRVAKKQKGISEYFDSSLL